MVEIGHGNGLDVEHNGEGRTQGCCWRLPLLGGWERKGFFKFFCFCLGRVVMVNSGISFCPSYILRSL